ncbi:MAG: LysR family transcriptional regulator [Alphaproteobacteria bacterium]|nr:LysR family transcriptional regulator [Alphaproteobacteria bacterium]
MSQLRPPKIRMPPYTALRAFETAARHESFVRAAEELSVTPGAVAQQVKLLEDWLGSPLFGRHRNGVALTAHGRRALPLLTTAIDTLGAAVQALHAEARPRALHIAALPAVAQLWLSPRLLRLKRAFPDLQVSVTALEEPPNFKRDLFDLGLFYSDSKASDREARDCDAIVLSKDRLVPVCAPSLRDESPLTELADLQRHTLLHDTAWESDWARWLDAAGLVGLDPESGPAYSLYSIALQSAIDGNGVLIGREILVEAALKDGRLVTPIDVRVEIAETLDLLVPAHRPRTTLMRALIEWMREAV